MGVVRHAGMCRLAQRPSSRPSIALSCQAAATRHPGLLHLFARGNDGRTAGRGRRLGLGLATCCHRRRALHACLLGGLGSVRVRLSPSLDELVRLDRKKSLLMLENTVYAGML